MGRKSRIAVLQHVPFEGPGHIAVWARQRGYAVTVCRLDNGDPFPPLRRTDILVLMGGPMNIYEEDRHPWLAAEKEYLRAAISAGTYILGICLGCQLIADALGSRVYTHTHREIGWFPVTTEGSAADNIFAAAAGTCAPAFHWHRDTFALPAGTRHLARSAACAQQAFMHGERILGLQFHWELTPAGIELLLTHCAAEMTPAEHIQDAQAIRRQVDFCPVAHRLLETLLDRFISAR